MLWYWCLDYALDGDLSRKERKMIEQSCDIPLKFLVKAGFIDSRPYRRIHDWWSIQGNYLKIRFRDQPENWQRIRDLYHKQQRSVEHMGNTPGNTPGVPVNETYGRTDVEYGRTDVRREKTSRDASLGASPRAASALSEIPEEEKMTPEEMKAIRIKNMGEW